MEDIDQNKLLPVGESIDLNDNDLQISRILGSGYTSVVYYGMLTIRENNEKKPVAVKAYKPVNIPEMRNTILEEGNTLKALNNFEKEIDDYAGIELQLVPTYYGSGNYQGITYLVMEFINGKDLASVLDARYVLPERLTTAIAWQFCRALELMHTKLNRTYIDMKLENLWLSDNDETKLRVIDLGMLQEIKPDASYIGNPRLDLLKAAIIFFKLATGKNLILDVNSLKHLAEPLIEEAKISWGLREFFKKGLSRNPSYRYQSAQEMKKSLYDLYEYWQLDEQTLLSAVSQLMKEYDEIKSNGDIELIREKVERSKAMLSVYDYLPSKQSGEVALELSKKVQEAYEATSYMTHGKALLDGTLYKGAENQFAFGESISIQQAEFRRWKLLAIMAGEVTSTVFTQEVEKQAKGAVDRMNDGDFLAAKNRLVSLKALLPPSHGLDALLAESEIFLGVETAALASTNGDYPSAARIYRETQNKVNKLPIPSKSLVDELGDLDIAAEENELASRTVVEADKLIEQAKRSFQENLIDDGIKLIQNAWNIHPTSSQFVPLLIEQMKRALSLNNLEFATKLGYISSYIDQQNTELFYLRETAARLTAIQFLFIKDDLDSAIKEIKLILAEPRLSDHAKPFLKKFISAKADIYIKAKDSNRLNILYEFIRESMEADPDLSSKIEKNLVELADETTPGLKRQVDILISDALLKLYTFDPTKVGDAAARWPLAKLIKDYQGRVVELKQIILDLKEIRNIANPINYRVCEIENISNRVSELIRTHEGEITDYYKEYLGTKSQLEDFKRKTEVINKQCSFLANAEENDISMEAQILIRKETLAKERDLLSELISYSIFQDPNDPEVNSLLSSLTGIINSTGAYTWDEIIHFAETQKADLFSRTDRIAVLINNGELETATGEISLLEKALVSNDIVGPLKRDVIQLYQIRDWTISHKEELATNKYNEDLLDNIQSILEGSQAKRVWKGSVLERYVEQVKNELENQLVRLSKTPEKREYFDVLKKWLHIQIMMRGISA